MKYIIIKLIPLLIILLGCSSTIFQSNKNSLNALPKSEKILDVVEGKNFFQDSRTIQQYFIKDSNLGIIDIAVSFPTPIPDHPLPVLFILGGLETGFESDLEFFLTKM